MTEAKAKMTPKQERFCQEYVIDCNGTQAAIRAGYSQHSANEIAAENLAKPNIRDRVAELQAKIAKKLEITAEKVLREIALLGFSNMQDYAEFSPDGVTLKESSELTREQMAAVSSVSETTTQHGGSVHFKLHDKRGSLELLGKNLALFIERHEHSLEPTLAQLMLEASKRNPVPKG